MRSVVVVEPGKVELVDIPQPSPGPYEVRIRTELACLCNATDGKLVAGKFPGVEDYPLLLGHESAGIMNDVLLAILGKENKQRHRLVLYWVVLTGLESPKAECQNTEICGGG